MEVGEDRASGMILDLLFWLWIGGRYLFGTE
jgi:hypothetical protein